MTTRPDDAHEARVGVEEIARDYAPVLPVAMEQLRDIGRDLEGAVVGICDGFRQMVVRARESARESRELLEGDPRGRSGVDTLVRTSEQSLEQLMKRLLHASETSMRAIYRIEDLQRGMQQITDTLQVVDEIALRARLLSVNAKLEAARLSGQGKAFGVVAAEISDVARLCATMGSTISGTVNQMRVDMEATVGELHTLASEDVNEILANRTAVTGALADVTHAHERIERSMRLVSDAGEALAADVGTAVVQMQFQDRTNQRLGHVIDALAEMHEELVAALAEVPLESPAEAAQRQRAILTRLAKAYTVAAEHGIHARLGGATMKDHQAEGSVDLF